MARAVLLLLLALATFSACGRPPDSVVAARQLQDDASQLQDAASQLQDDASQLQDDASQLQDAAPGDQDVEVADFGDLIDFQQEQPELQEEASVATKSEKVKQALRKTEQVLLSELHRRLVQTKSASLKKVFSAGKKLGDAVKADYASAKKFVKKVKNKAKKKAKKIAKKMKKKKKKKEKKEKKVKGGLWQSMLSLMPPAAWFAVLLLVFCGLVVLCLGVYLCLRRSGAKEKHLKKELLTLTHKDLVAGEKPPYGMINYSLEYDLQLNILIVTINNCVGLPKGLEDIDPYVVIKIDDEKEVIERSNVMKRNRDPVFNYVRKFKIKDCKKLKEKKLTFEIYDWDLSTNHRMLARKVVKLSDLGDRLDDILGRPIFECKQLSKGKELHCRAAGDVCLSINYLRAKKQLSVIVIEFKSVYLQKKKDTPDMDTLPNTFVQVTLRQMHSGKSETRKSEVVKQNRNPYFNFKCGFDIQQVEKLKTCTLVIELVHKTETLGIKRPVGSLELSGNSIPGSLLDIHWKDVLRLQGSALARWHTLEPYKPASRGFRSKSNKKHDRASDSKSSDS